MRIDNSKVKNSVISLYFLLVVFAVVFLILYNTFFEVPENSVFLFFIFILFFIVILLMIQKISKYFEYDSDGIQVVIRNKGMLLSDYFNYREYKLEFKKDQLIGYKFNNYFIYKSLELIIKSSRGKKRKETFNVSLVNRKKRRYIRQSLSKITKHNSNLKKQMNDR